MLEGLKSLPFVSVDEENRIISANNPWISNKLRYVELEEGLWLMLHDSHFKANICGKAIYESKVGQYYSLFYNINRSRLRTENMKLKDIDILSRSCTLHSPQSDIVAYIPKGTHAWIVNFLFDKAWVERNINYRSLPTHSYLKKFFTGQQPNMICNDFNKNAEHLIDEIFSVLDNQKLQSLSLFRLKNMANELLFAMMSHLEGVHIPDTKAASGDVRKKGLHKQSFVRSPFSQNRFLEPSFDHRLISVDEKFLLKFKEVVEHRLADPALSVATLSIELGMSRAQLSRKVNRLTGIPIHEYIRVLRLKKAAVMLSCKTGAVSEVAYAVGFTNLSYFAKCFKQQFHKNPKDYLTYQTG